MSDAEETLGKSWLDTSLEVTVLLWIQEGVDTCKLGSALYIES